MEYMGNFYMTNYTLPIVYSCLLAIHYHWILDKFVNLTQIDEKFQIKIGNYAKQSWKRL